MNNFKAAARSLLATPGPTLVVIATLAIAIGANTAIFSIVNGVLLQPLGYAHDDQLVVLWAGNESGATFRLSPADYRDVRDNVEAFGGYVGLYRSIGSTMTGLDRPVRIGTMTATPPLFRALGAKPAIGQLFSVEDEKPGGPKKILLTHASWTRRFGADPNLVGGTVELDSEPYTVVGVTEAGFQFPPGNDEIEMYFPMRLSDRILLDREHRMFDAVARLEPGVSVEAARAELDAMAVRLEREFPDTNTGWSLTAVPLRQELFGDVARTLWVLSGAVFLVLLIACANVANILIARSTSTGREFAVRAAMGACRSDLGKRSLAESLILGFLGGTAGVLFAIWGTRMLRSVMPADIVRGNAIRLDGTVLLFAVVLSIGSAVLFGLLPALRSMATDVLELLKPSGGRGPVAGGGRRLRETVVVVEIALAIVLLVGAGLMVRSFTRLSEVDPGFRPEGVVSVAVQLPRSRYGRDEWRPFFEELVDRVEGIPGVHAAGAVSDLPMSDVGLGFELEFTVVGLDAISPTANPNAEVRMALPGYFEAMDMEIVQGRAFDGLDTTSERPVAIVNQTVVDRYFPEFDPIGRKVGLALLGDVEVVGVVSDVRHNGLQSKYESEIFLPYGKISTAEMHIVVHSDLETPMVASGVRDILADMDPQLAPTEVAALSDLLWQSVAQPRFNTALLTGLALCAAVLAIFGTYGIVAYGVSQRRSEIGVRMALGADSAATVLMIVRQALAIVVVGAVLGLVGALGVTRFLGQLLFDVPPTDPLTYGVVLVATVAVGALAAWTPARKATRIDPVAALRDD